MYTLGALLLSALLLGAVISVIESVLQVVGAHGAISKLPIIGAHLSLIIAIGMVWLLDMNPIAGWGVSFSDEWMTYVANGAIILGMIPLKDAVINMVNKGLRAYSFVTYFSCGLSVHWNRRPVRISGLRNVVRFERLSVIRHNRPHTLQTQ